MGRHGFPIGEPSDRTLRILRTLLPSGEHQNPGGFKERWEIKKVGKETILFIPQEVLASIGKPYKVRGNSNADLREIAPAVGQSVHGAWPVDQALQSW